MPLKIKSHSGIYTLEVKQEINTTLEDAWDFFSAPKNLSKITPSHMGFFITSEVADKMYEGQIITYEIGVLPGIKSNWVTEITHIVDKKYFVDEQRFGPYSMWHHEHSFEETEKGVMMTDSVSYKVPFGVLGRVIHSLLIKKQLLAIFQFRIEEVDKNFNK